MDKQQVISLMKKELTKRKYMRFIVTGKDLFFQTKCIFIDSNLMIDIEEALNSYLVEFNCLTAYDFYNTEYHTDYIDCDKGEEEEMKALQAACYKYKSALYSYTIQYANQYPLYIRKKYQLALINLAKDCIVGVQPDMDKFTKSTIEKFTKEIRRAIGAYSYRYVYNHLIK